MIEMSQEVSPVLEAVQEELDRLPSPTVGQKNVHHFLSSDGDLTIKAVPWINPIDGVQIEENPTWTRLFEDNTNVSRADFIANLPNPSTDSDSSEKTGGRDLLNPLTEEIVEKIVPWIDPNDGTIIFEKYIPGIEVSRGKKVSYQHNPDQKFDDPADPHNLRFFEWNFDIQHRVINTVFREIDMRKDKDIGVIGINLGGTIMMEEKEQGLVPTGQIQQMFENYVEENQKNCMVRSFVFPKAKMTSVSEANYGIDSSQLEIDVIADIAIAMTCIWNDLSEKERKEFAGFVISIGTDTCVDTMAILKMMLGPTCPFSVIAVGAMKPMLEEDSDGLINFRSAFDDLVELRKRGLKVIGLRVEGGLYDPTKTRKISDKLGPSFQGKKIIDSTIGEVAESVDSHKFDSITEDSFKQPYHEAIAFRGVDEVKFIKSTVSKDPFSLRKEVKNSDEKVILVETYPSFTQAMKDVDAIVEGARGKPIFYVNQVLGADVDQAYEVAKELSKHGIYPLNMTAETARAKINLAVRLLGDDNQKIIDFITNTDFVGEQPEDFLSKLPTQTADEGIDDFKNKVASSVNAIRPQD